MQKPLKPNHLAKLIDHQRSAASTLPKPLENQWSKLNQLTQEIKKILDSGLPEEILDSLWVVKYEEGHLILSVQSQTAANHLKYQANNLIHILKTQSLTFSLLKNINVIVTYPASIGALKESKDCSKQSNSSLNLNENHNTYGLTDLTKRTITHSLEHVIFDQRLKTALKKLIKPN